MVTLSETRVTTAPSHPIVIKYVGRSSELIHFSCLHLFLCSFFCYFPIHFPTPSRKERSGFQARVEHFVRRDTSQHYTMPFSIQHPEVEMGTSKNVRTIWWIYEFGLRGEKRSPSMSEHFFQKHYWYLYANESPAKSGISSCRTEPVVPFFLSSSLPPPPPPPYIYIYIYIYMRCPRQFLSASYFIFSVFRSCSSSMFSLTSWGVSLFDWPNSFLCQNDKDNDGWGDACDVDRD